MYVLAVGVFRNVQKSDRHSIVNNTKVNFHRQYRRNVIRHRVSFWMLIMTTIIFQLRTHPDHISGQLTYPTAFEHEFENSNNIRGVFAGNAKSPRGNVSFRLYQSSSFRTLRTVFRVLTIFIVPSNPHAVRFDGNRLDQRISVRPSWNPATCYDAGKAIAVRRNRRVFYYESVYVSTERSKWFWLSTSYRHGWFPSKRIRV